jgi:hypothetical protein
MTKVKIPVKTYSVDIQFTTEFTYRVEARTPGEAEKLARRMYESGDDSYVHSEVFDSQITNVEEIE